MVHLWQKNVGKRKSTKNLTIDQFCTSSSAKARAASRIASLIVMKLGSSKKKIAFSSRQTRSCLITVALVSPYPSRPTTPQFFERTRMKEEPRSGCSRKGLGWNFRRIQQNQVLDMQVLLQQIKRQKTLISKHQHVFAIGGHQDNNHGLGAFENYENSDGHLRCMEFHSPQVSKQKNVEIQLNHRIKVKQ